MQIVCNLFFVFQVVLWKDKATWGREEAPVGSEWARGFLDPRLGVQEERLLSLGERRRYCQALQNQVRNMRALQICLQFINYFQLNNCEKAKIDIQRKITFWVKKDCPITLQTDFCIRFPFICFLAIIGKNIEPTRVARWNNLNWGYFTFSQGKQSCRKYLKKRY